MSELDDAILKYLQDGPSKSSKEIFEGLEGKTSYATIKRALAKLVSTRDVQTEGRRKGTKYRISRGHELLHSININTYFAKEQDERIVKDSFNFSLLNDSLRNIDLFSVAEERHLDLLQAKFQDNIAHLEPTVYNKEMERLAIDLSWKSSQIEGNTYTLLETERLLKEQETAAGKPKDDAIMLLNHKEAICFIIENPDYIVPLTTRSIEDIHSILTKDLGVDRNIRQRRVGVTGTNYKPLDNEHQIREALQEMCSLINATENVFEKSLFAIVLLSYIQAFNDGNKRTARIVGNAILIANQYCLISFRTVDSIEYKKAMLIFYEQNNISAFKKIFIEQFEFAVNTYF